MISKSNHLKSSTKSLPENGLNRITGISLDDCDLKALTAQNFIPKISSDLIFQSQDLSNNNIDLNSALSFKKTPSSDFHLDSFTNDSSYTNDNGSIEQFKTSQNSSSNHVISQEINVATYFDDLYRREIEASHSATKEECLIILEPYSIEQYATAHFRKQQGILVFNKQGIKKLTTFSEKPFHKPLLEKTPLSKKSIVEKFSTYILLYIGLKHDISQDMYYKGREEEQKTLQFLAILSMIHNDESLINEFFMQLMKAMRDIPTQEALLLSWNLFLTASSVFYVHDWEVQNVIRWFIINRMFYDDVLGEYAKYSLICFHDRTIIEKSVDSRTTKKEILDVPLMLRNGKKVFQCSLYSQMWDQKRKYPKLPIPLALYLVIKALVKYGVMITPKPFPFIKLSTLMPRSFVFNSKSNGSKESQNKDKLESDKSKETNDNKKEIKKENNIIQKDDKISIKQK